MNPGDDIDPPLELYSISQPDLYLNAYPLCLKFPNPVLMYKYILFDVDTMNLLYFLFLDTVELDPVPWKTPSLLLDVVKGDLCLI